MEWYIWSGLRAEEVCDVNGRVDGGEMEKGVKGEEGKGGFSLASCLVSVIDAWRWGDIECLFGRGARS